MRTPFAFDPFFSIGENFFFPDRDFALEAIDAGESGFESGASVGCSGDNHNARFANGETPEAMYDADLADREFSHDLPADVFHLLDGHGLITIVFEIRGSAAFGVVADNSFEHDDGAVFGTLEILR